MIIDTIDNLGKYVGMNPLFADVVAFLKDHDLNTMEAGKHPIKGSDLFVNITTAKGRSKTEAVLETHIDMIDIQIPLDTEETFGYTPLKDLPAFEYNAEKDITKYGDVRWPSSSRRTVTLPALLRKTSRKQYSKFRLSEQNGNVFSFSNVRKIKRSLE